MLPPTHPSPSALFPNTQAQRLAVVVPVLNEAAGLSSLLAHLQPLRARGALVVVADGGSQDGTSDLLQQAQAEGRIDAWVAAPPGRAAQMNAGALWALKALQSPEACNAEPTRTHTLLFLHADTRLPPNADLLIARALSGPAAPCWGRFDVRIEGRHPGLRVVQALMNLRSRLTGIATGDQAIFVRSKDFLAVGGFPAQPLMEDIELSARLRRLTPPACLREQVLTSGRRWESRGLWRTIRLMWRLRAHYFAAGDRVAASRQLALDYGYTVRPMAAVSILAKAPVPGLAKTRLQPLLGAAGAARAQRAFTLRALRTAFEASTGPCTLWCAPDPAHRLFRLLRLRFGIACAAQSGGDLGQRMAHTVAEHFREHPGLPLLLMGTDCPALTPAHLQAAAAALVDHDAVLIPAEDGGYVIIGLRQPRPGLFPEVFQGVAWSTERVAAQTRERLQAAGARWAELPTLWDVDEPQDWLRLQAQGGLG
ncbi:MAG: TIGR04283 family arsenosugar biosynthesis glycosyltransferase [Serpentinimonas sp.]|nr:TIGR04283 family arsenosugar biosynthesis glycosyltransferase [Serpentinimonas sp.]